jgi:dienelactone hydrolase
MIERFAHMPAALRANARWERLGNSAIPALLVHPDWNSAAPAPVVIWMHGRTANKELDPGRYLRWMRAGVGACAIDLPGHGERFDASYQDGARTPEILRQIVDEIDEVVEALRDIGSFDMQRLAIGGMSAGGMAALARLCKPHTFRCASVEATTGDWTGHFGARLTPIADLNPIAHLDGWREIPFQAIHARHDQIISFDGQGKFIDALRKRYADPNQIDFVAYDQTGAPSEHIGFGRHAADAKDRQREFFRRQLLNETMNGHE